MGYRKEVADKTVEGIDHNIEVTDSKYTFNQKLDLIFEEDMTLTEYHNFTVKGIDGTDYFKCGYINDIDKNIDSVVVYGLYNEPICNLDNSFHISTKINIYKNDNNEKSIAVIKDKESTSGYKYTLEFTNLINDTIEKLDINCDFDYRICGIFYGKEKSGAPMVCKIVRNLFYANLYKIEVASGIDLALMTVITLFFMKKSLKENKGKYPSVISNRYLNDFPLCLVERPLKNFTVVDSKYIYEKPEILIINEEKSIISDYLCDITDIDGKVLYKVEEKTFKDILIDSSNNESIINVVQSIDVDIKRNIFLGRKKEKCIGIIKSISSNLFNKFSLELLNSETNTFEKFIINCDPHYYYASILYLNENNHTSLVCKYIKDQYEKFNYQIEIAPGVDSVMMIAPILFLINKCRQHNDNLSEKNNQNQNSTLSNLKSITGSINNIFFK